MSDRSYWRTSFVIAWMNILFIWNLTLHLFLFGIHRVYLTRIYQPWVLKTLSPVKMLIQNGSNWGQGFSTLPEVYGGAMDLWHMTFFNRSAAYLKSWNAYEWWQANLVCSIKESPPCASWISKLTTRSHSNLWEITLQGCFQIWVPRQLVLELNTAGSFFFSY